MAMAPLWAYVRIKTLVFVWISFSIVTSACNDSLTANRRDSRGNREKNVASSPNATAEKRLGSENVEAGAELVGPAIKDVPPSIQSLSQLEVPAKFEVSAVSSTTGSCIAPSLPNDRDVLQSLIDCAIATGEGEVRLEARTYFLTCDSFRYAMCLKMENAKNLVLRGIPGLTRIVVKTNRSGVLILGNSFRVKLMDLIFDYEVPPFAQGVIQSVDPKTSTFVYRADAGYPQPDDPLLTTDLFVDGVPQAIGQIINPQDLRSKDSPADYVGLSPQMSRVGPGLWKMQVIGRSPLSQYMSPGDRFAYGARSSSAFYIHHSEDVAFERVQIYTSPSIAVVASGNSGNLMFESLSIVPSPGSNRVLSSVADALHFENNRASITVKNSHFAGMGDDAINTYGRQMKIHMVSGQSMVMDRPPFGKIQVGDRLSITNYSKQVAKTYVDYEPVVTSVGGDGPFIPLTVDRVLQGVVPGDLVFDVELAARALIVTKSTFGPFRGQIRAHSATTMFYGNYFEDRRNARILRGLDTSWNEGPAARDPFTYKNTVFNGGLQILGKDFAPSGYAVYEWCPNCADASSVPTFAWSQYVRMYPDLAKMDASQAVSHWSASGIHEGRSGSIFLSAPEYQEVFTDLKAAWPGNFSMLVNHFDLHGRFEGRVGRLAWAKGGFSSADLRMQVADLAELPDMELLAAWLWMITPRPQIPE